MVAVLLCLAAPAPARAEAGGAKARPPAGRWALVCPSFTQGKANNCRITQRIGMKKPKGLLMAASVRAFRGRKPPALLLHLPHGVYLPAGVKLLIDGAPLKTLQYQTCNRRGCFAGMKLPPETLGRLKSGKLLVVVMRNLSRQNIKLTLSLTGFAAAYEKMTAN